MIEVWWAGVHTTSEVHIVRKPEYLIPILKAVVFLLE